MSWSAYTVGTADQINDQIDALTTYAGDFQPTAEQLSAAKEAAKGIIASGAAGVEVSYSVSLSGHANPDHKPAPGYANDAITISVTQVNQEAVDTFNKNLQAQKLAQE